jgi:hypothetical protein
MMNDELAAIAGRYEELVGRLQEKYGIASDKAKRQVDEFREIVEHLKQSNARLITQKRSSRKRVVRRAAKRTTPAKRRKTGGASVKGA